MLIAIPQLLTADDLREAHASLTDAPWQDGRASAGTQAAQVKHNDQLPHSCEAAQRIGQRVLQRLDQNPLFISAALTHKVLTPRVNRYRSAGAQHYGPHIDAAVRLQPDGGQLRTDLSCTVFLNEAQDYDGGELVVRDSYGEHAVKLPAGHAVLYPGTSLHEVRPVTRGQRLACFFWVQSLVRSDEQRRLLFDLDMNLTRLRQRHGDSAETVALTGVYHNLLRQWAET